MIEVAGLASIALILYLIYLLFDYFNRSKKKRELNTFKTQIIFLKERCEHTMELIKEHKETQQNNTGKISE